MVCIWFASAFFWFAFGFLLLCFWFAHCLLLRCFCFASALLLLCFCFASALLLLCSCFASSLLLVSFWFASGSFFETKTRRRTTRAKTTTGRFLTVPLSMARAFVCKTRSPLP